MENKNSRNREIIDVDIPCGDILRISSAKSCVR